MGKPENKQRRQYREDDIRRRKNWVPYLIGAVITILVIVVVYAQVSHEKNSTKQEHTTPATTSTVQSETDLISNIAQKDLKGITMFSVVGCGVDGAPPDSKTVNVISATHYTKDDFTQRAGTFLEDVFSKFPNVYYVQLKGTQAGEDVIAFEVCRADVSQLSHLDWDVKYVDFVRNYWENEQ